MLPKQNPGTLNESSEPNLEVQMDFAGTISCNNYTNNYIIVTVDHL